MGIVAIMPVSQMAAANTALQAAGWGPIGFSVPAFGNGLPTYAALHAWGPLALIAAIKARSGVIFNEGNGDPATRLIALLAGVGAQWGGNAPLLQGNVTPGLYRAIPADGGALWWVIQAFNRTVFGAALATYPALVRQARVPGEVAPWVQPIDQFDAYWTKNAFTGQPDRVTHNGRLWRSTVADPTPNVWAPGTAGIWADEGPAV